MPIVFMRFLSSVVAVSSPNSFLFAFDLIFVRDWGVLLSNIAMSDILNPANNKMHTLSSLGDNMTSLPNAE